MNQMNFTITLDLGTSLGVLTFLVIAGAFVIAAHYIEKKFGDKT